MSLAPEEGYWVAPVYYSGTSLEGQRKKEPISFDALRLKFGMEFSKSDPVLLALIELEQEKITLDEFITRTKAQLKKGCP